MPAIICTRTPLLTVERQQLSFAPTPSWMDHPGEGLHRQGIRAASHRRHAPVAQPRLRAPLVRPGGVGPGDPGHADRVPAPGPGPHRLRRRRRSGGRGPHAPVPAAHPPGRRARRPLGPQGHHGRLLGGERPGPGLGGRRLRGRRSDHPPDRRRLPGRGLIRRRLRARRDRGPAPGGADRAAADRRGPAAAAVLDRRHHRAAAGRGAVQRVHRPAVRRGRRLLRGGERVPRRGAHAPPGCARRRAVDPGGGGRGGALALEPPAHPLHGRPDRDAQLLPGRGSR